MIYYKGFIVSDTYIKSHKYKTKIGEDIWANKVNDLNDIGLDYDILADIPDDIRKMLKRDILNNIKRGITPDENKKICKYFEKNFEPFINEQIDIINNTNLSNGGSTFIIYELVKDREGNLFGREIYTKALFPIYNNKCQAFDFKLRVEKDKGHDWHNYFLTIECFIEVSSLLKTTEIIVNHQVADQNDLEAYERKFSQKRSFRRNSINLDDFKKHIITLANKNVFKENFSLEEKKEKIKVAKEKQSNETSLMEDIDYSLMKLKNINQDLYLEYMKKYESLLDGNFNLATLSLFAGELEFYLIFKKREVEDILETLNNLKKEYFDNLLNHEDSKTDLDIKKLDKINELFLKIKDRYSYKNQREVLRNLALLYLMETYENIDSIDIEELEHSYFAMHLKTIVIWINLFTQENIIECSYLTSLREDLNVEIVLDMIKNIEFKKIQNDKVKKLITNI
ncbi:MAG: hypothetical protein IKN63_03920 [Bacilli bacterium]|nr:hypothetical protein [Bacilli bacterium]